MNEFRENPQIEPQENIMAILKSPQSSTSVTKFAGPYINSIILEQNSPTEDEE